MNTSYTTKNDILVELMDIRELFANSNLASIIELAILEIEQLRSDKANVASDLYAGVRR
jgi:hypothetical protein